MQPSDSGPGAEYNIEASLREAAAAIESARTLVKQGTVVDLEGLEAHIEEACGAIPKLAPEDRNRLKPTLVSLIDGLNLLSDQISAQHEELSGSLQDIGTRFRAVSAYKPRGSR